MQAWPLQNSPPSILDAVTLAMLSIPCFAWDLEESSNNSHRFHR